MRLVHVRHHVEVLIPALEKLQETPIMTKSSDYFAEVRRCSQETAASDGVTDDILYSESSDSESDSTTSKLQEAEEALASIPVDPDVY